MLDTILEGSTSTGAHVDFTIKVDARFAEWSPSRFFYQFAAGDAVSPVGQFTLPPPEGQRLESLSFGVFSCADWSSGYFNVYRAAAAHSPRIDFWLQLGDWLYEYAQPGTAGAHPDVHDSVRFGSLEPSTELVSLDEYRQRHALYRTDADLQALCAAAPLIASWDDHEVANDQWVGGAQNHQPDTEGSWEARKRAAVRAYHEWMPTRTRALADFAEQVRAYRAIQFGDLAKVHVLESRMVARTRQARSRQAIEARVLEAIGDLPPARWEAAAGPRLRQLAAELEAERTAPAATLLGNVQLQWLQRGLQAGPAVSDASEGAQPQRVGTARWQLIGQQTVVMEHTRPNLTAAIERARSAGAGALAAAWQEAIANVTEPASSSASPPRTHALYSQSGAPLGPALPVDGATLTAGRLLLAKGQFGVDSNFDGWSGYKAERERLLAMLGQVANAVIYAGDSHCAWAGTHAAAGNGSSAARGAAAHADAGASLAEPLGATLEPRDAVSKHRLLAAEYGTASTTSYGMSDYTPFLPPSLLSAAHLAAHENLLFSDTAHRGWLHVSLTHARHTATFRVVESTAARDSAERCEAVFVQEARGSGGAGVEMPRRQPCGSAEAPAPPGFAEAGERRGALLVPVAALAGVVVGAVALGASAALLLLAFRASCVRKRAGLDASRDEQDASSRLGWHELERVQESSQPSVTSG